MTPEERIHRERIAQAIAERNRRKPIWTPNPPRDGQAKSTQQMALESTARIIGFGGAARGGKTDLAIGKALTQHKKTMILRRESPQFEAIRTRFSELVGADNLKNGTEVRWSGDKHPSITAEKIELCHLQHPHKHWMVYSGRPHDFLVFDEAVQFPLNIIRILMTWCVATDLDPERAAKRMPGTFAQVLMTFNPPRNAAGMWVMEYFGPWMRPNFVDAAKRPFRAESGEVLHVAFIQNKEYFYHEPTEITHHPTTGAELPDKVKTVSRTFIQSTLDDNPHYSHTSYADDLQALAHDDYMAFRFGVFTELVGEKLGQIVRQVPWKAAQDRWKKIDTPPSLPLCIGLDTSQGGDDDNAYYPIGYGGYVWEKGLLAGKAHSQHHEIRQWLEVHGMSQYLENDAWRNSIAEISQCMWLESEMRRRWNVSPDEIPICLDYIGGRAFLAIWSMAFTSSVVYQFKGSESPGVRGILRRESDEDSNKPKEQPTINPLSGLPFITEGETYTNKIAAAYCRFGDALLHPAYSIAVPDDTETTIQVMSRIRGSNGKRTAINSKESVLDELGKSPNEADALVMAFWYLDVVIGLGIV